MVKRISGGRRGPGVLLANLWLFLVAVQAATGQELSTVAKVERGEVFLGESLVFQIEVRGDDGPEEPDLSALADFHVQSLGGQARNSESVTIVGGQISRVTHRGYLFSYRLTPKRVGAATIPSIEVSTGGQRLRTRPVVVQVREPAETDDFKLRLTLSKARGYVGEPVTLTATWYIGKDVRGFQFTLPVLDDERFSVHDPKVQIDPAKQYYRVPLGIGEVVAEKGQGNLGGKTYATLSFSKVLVPKESGAFQIPGATVTCEALVGHRESRDLFERFFSEEFFGRGRRGVYQKFVTPSNDLTLHVAGLPEKGRPPNFAGHVGPHLIEAAATPTEANVGDPITLTIKLSGPEVLGDIELPPLKNQPALTRDFRIPDEMASGVVAGKVKTFSQTVRAMHAEVKQIPPIELPYFDTESRSYSVARTQPIPIAIRGTRVITARDAEGRELTALKSELTEWSKGIAHNYEDLSVLENQHYELATLIRTPFWMGLTLGPLVIYVVLLLSTVVIRRAQADPEGRDAKKAYSRLRRSLENLRNIDDSSRMYRQVLEAFRDYFGKKLRLKSRALTYRDVEGALETGSVRTQTLEDLRKLFEECEAGHYAGGDGVPGDAASIRNRALGLAKDLEQSLG